jgi:DNA-binding beta-propeller fold protein YncE
MKSAHSTHHFWLRFVNVLRVPRGIALDKNKNVYVTGRETQNVVVLSPDGKTCRQILAKSDGLNEPISLCINIDPY